ncbi:hypothetical protein HK405_000180, partial [Cladochytrium tenue]
QRRGGPRVAHLVVRRAWGCDGTLADGARVPPALLTADCRSRGRSGGGGGGGGAFSASVLPGRRRLSASGVGAVDCGLLPDVSSRVSIGLFPALGRGLRVHAQLGHAGVLLPSARFRFVHVAAAAAGPGTAASAGGGGGRYSPSGSVELVTRGEALRRAALAAGGARPVLAACGVEFGPAAATAAGFVALASRAGAAAAAAAAASAGTSSASAASAGGGGAGDVAGPAGVGAGLFAGGPVPSATSAAGRRELLRAQLAAGALAPVLVGGLRSGGFGFAGGGGGGGGGERDVAVRAVAGGGLVLLSAELERHLARLQTETTEGGTSSAVAAVAAATAVRWVRVSSPRYAGADPDPEDADEFAFGPVDLVLVLVAGPGEGKVMRLVGTAAIAGGGGPSAVEAAVGEGCTDDEALFVY